MVTRARIPDEVLAAAHARSRARAERDWPEADRLRAEIESAGWKVVDRGTDFALAPAVPPDVVVDGRVLYGSSASVPSRLEAAPVGTATVVIVAPDEIEWLEATLSGLRDHAPDGVQIVIAADAADARQAPALAALDALDPGGPGVATEVVWTREALGYAAALNAAIRRAQGPIVMILEPGVAVSGDVVSPLVGALDDRSVAVAGAWGLTGEDVTRLDEASAGDVDAIDGGCLAFRRADYVARGPLDEAFRVGRHLDVWWSLALRDGGEGELSRSAVALGGLPIDRLRSAPDPALARVAKRNGYRLRDRFGRRSDLLSAGSDGLP
ncbi:MAG TPA: glycosyltransferase [Candidatus Limnocylindrales bacterium]|nr:glycosyltransferase [Candidatus Limnocylindrales bacterium]